NEFYENSLIPANTSLNLYLWQMPYQLIYSCNAVLEGLGRSEGVSEMTKGQLRGEALFIRAFCYFYLTNLFGNVPLHLTTDYRMNMQAPRTPQAAVYAAVITDLKEAQALLPEDYTGYGGERTRPIRGAADALLARVYLYTGAY